MSRLDGCGWHDASGAGAGGRRGWASLLLIQQFTPGRYLLRHGTGRGQDYQKIL